MKYKCVKDCGKELKCNDKVNMIEDYMWETHKIYKNGKYLGYIYNDQIPEYFTPDIEECTVTKEEAYKQLAKSCERNEKKTLKGWQILKLIDEGKVTDGTIFTTIDKERNWSFIYVDGALEIDNDELYAVDLINSDFIINKHTEPITFKEALERNVNIKHKDWKIEYTTPQNVLNHYTKIENAEILQDLFSDDKVWEVETDD